MTTTYTKPYQNKTPMSEVLIYSVTTTKRFLLGVGHVNVGGADI